MVSVQQTIKEVEVGNYLAVLETYWSSHEEETDLLFYLYDLKNEKMIKGVSAGTKGDIYKNGNFTKDDVLREYGKLFDDWVKESAV